MQGKGEAFKYSISGSHDSAPTPQKLLRKLSLKYEGNISFEISQVAPLAVNRVFADVLCRVVQYVLTISAGECLSIEYQQYQTRVKVAACLQRSQFDDRIITIAFSSQGLRQTLLSVWIWPFSSFRSIVSTVDPRKCGCDQYSSAEILPENVSPELMGYITAKWRTINTRLSTGDQRRPNLHRAVDGYCSVMIISRLHTSVASRGGGMGSASRYSCEVPVSWPTRQPHTFAIHIGRSRIVLLGCGVMLSSTGS